MLPVGEVLPAVIVFLDCGYLGRHGISPRDAAVLVLIERLCGEHAGPEPQLRYLEQWELVSPSRGPTIPDSLQVLTAIYEPTESRRPT